MGKCCECSKDKSAMESQFNDEENQNNKIFLTEDVIKYINSSQTEQRINTKEESNKKNSPIHLPKNSYFSFNKNSEENPDIIDEIIRKVDFNNIDKSLNESKNDDNQFSVSLITMEKKLFELINDLRENPKSFIDKVEEYKKKLQINNNSYYIVIEDNIFQLRKGPEDFDECINFLKNQKNLEKFESSPSMFEAKTLFQDKNVSDLYFVLIYNLIDANANSSENDKIKRNCIMSEIYSKLNITITKKDFVSNLYTFYFAFDQ